MPATVQSNQPLGRTPQPVEGIMAVFQVKVQVQHLSLPQRKFPAEFALTKG